ncbi:MAG: helix-turn-helix transcriptional regulator [Clostridia bacterium]|nr:helix-turn-helix transcriptional regulator [Clostridia bacterium]
MIRKQLGIRLKKLRSTQTQLSQEEFAYSINMDRTYYSSVENGNRNISLLNIKKIATGLGITLEEMFKDIEKEDIKWAKKN